LARKSVRGWSRVPKPAARIIPFIGSSLQVPGFSFQVPSFGFGMLDFEFPLTAVS